MMGDINFVLWYQIIHMSQKYFAFLQYVYGALYAENIYVKHFIALVLLQRSLMDALGCVLKIIRLTLVTIRFILIQFSI